ncbi:hypothetical protein P280DRAFT_140482 [Massarina eburnea CBS 473.64]|uniref:Uncharacterized protein n=1 Tax=Massarina eburnea CBS 473.64 TaxID=1395130 RepID=A0A6A6RNC4_9PLEO|nr:hypothetical protein P280DRAFT_140482 [Massarina eburnea CBS 473.64]
MQNRKAWWSVVHCAAHKLGPLGTVQAVERWTATTAANNCNFLPLTETVSVPYFSKPTAGLRNAPICSPYWHLLRGGFNVDKNRRSQKIDTCEYLLPSSCKMVTRVRRLPPPSSQYLLVGTASDLTTCYKRWARGRSNFEPHSTTRPEAGTQRASSLGLIFTSSGPLGLIIAATSTTQWLARRDCSSAPSSTNRLRQPPWTPWTPYPNLALLLVLGTILIHANNGMWSRCCTVLHHSDIVYLILAAGSLEYRYPRYPSHICPHSSNNNNQVNTTYQLHSFLAVRREAYHELGQTARHPSRIPPIVKTRTSI